jgi:hypothetical protein
MALGDSGCGSGFSSSVSINSTCDATDLSVAEFMNCMANSSQDYASDAATKTSDIAARIVCEAIGTDWNIARNEEKFETSAKPIAIPGEIDNTVSRYDAQRDSLIPYIGSNLDDFMGKWWNVLYNPAYTASAAKILDIILHGVTGIPDDQEVKIWGAVEGTITSGAYRAYNEVLASSRRRGWPTNQFTLQAAEMARQRAMLASGAARREIAFKRYEIQDNNMRFAVAEANKLFGQIGDRAAGYLNAFVGALDNALKSVAVDPNVMSNRINAVANLFGKEIELDQLRFTSLNSFHERIAADKRLESSNILGRLGSIINAGDSAANVHGKIATAFLSQIATIMQLAGSE